MLIVVSPAKRLDWTEVPEFETTSPRFSDDAIALARTARRLSKPKLQALMDISPDLAKLNKARFEAFSDNPSTDITRPAVRAFAGDTYIGLDASSLEPEAMNWAQDHLRILSGLYGVLRPRDAIQAYRLEMGSRLSTRRGRNLYAYWGDRIAAALRADAATLSSDVLVNCASQEYFGAVAQDALGLRVITPAFLEDKPDGPKMVSFFAKKARGAMARYIIDRRLTDPDGLMDFDLGGYRYDPARSQPDAPVFVRPLDADTGVAA